MARDTDQLEKYVQHWLNQCPLDGISEVTQNHLERIIVLIHLIMVDILSSDFPAVAAIHGLIRYITKVLLQEMGN